MRGPAPCPLKGLSPPPTLPAHTRGLRLGAQGVLGGWGGEGPHKHWFVDAPWPRPARSSTELLLKERKNAVHPSLVPPCHRTSREHKVTLSWGVPGALKPLGKYTVLLSFLTCITGVMRRA